MNQICDFFNYNVCDILRVYIEIIWRIIYIFWQEFAHIIVKFECMSWKVRTTCTIFNIVLYWKNKIIPEYQTCTMNSSWRQTLTELKMTGISSRHIAVLVHITGLATADPQTVLTGTMDKISRHKEHNQKPPKNVLHFDSTFSKTRNSWQSVKISIWTSVKDSEASHLGPQADLRSIFDL